MDIYISTLGRPNDQITLGYIQGELLGKTHLVVARHEYESYKKVFDGDIIVLPEDIIGLSANRQWLTENMKGEYICFMDDDLIFNIRKKGTTQLEKCKRIDGLIELWEDWLSDGYGMVGVSSRNGNNRILEPYEDNTRIMSAYAFNRKIVMKEKIRFDAIRIMQDFHVNLSLLEKGYPNRISYIYAHSQGKGSGAKGGCATYRTAEVKRKGSYRLASLHPKTVSVRSKTTKTGWKGMDKKKGVEGNVSTDVTIQWKESYKPKRVKTNRSNGIGRFL